MRRSKHFKYTAWSICEPMVNLLKNMGETEHSIVSTIGVGAIALASGRDDGKVPTRIYYALKGFLCEKQEKGGEARVNPVIIPSVSISQIEALVGISALTYARGRKLFSESDAVTATELTRKLARRLADSKGES